MRGRERKKKRERKREREREKREREGWVGRAGLGYHEKEGGRVFICSEIYF